MRGIYFINGKTNSLAIHIWAESQNQINVIWKVYEVMDLCYTPMVLFVLFYMMEEKMLLNKHIWKKSAQKVTFSCNKKKEVET